MKIAVPGKGGVGKTTVSAMLAMGFRDSGQDVLAVDADPAGGLGQALGFPDTDRIVPMVEMEELIEERTGAKPGTVGAYFKLNPKVDDIPGEYCASYEGMKLMVMGTIKKGGGGCACPENTFLKALIDHMLFTKGQTVILDMEAGVEHLGRATAAAVDEMIMVVEPGRRSIDVALKIKKLAKDVGIDSLSIIANKVREGSQKEFIKKAMDGFNILGFIPYDDKLVETDMSGKAVFGSSESATDEIRRIIENLQA